MFGNGAEGPRKSDGQMRSPIRVAVVGHVEWAEFAIVDHVPVAGEIVQATETWEEPAGGGAVAAVQLAKLNGSCLFLTAVSDDPLGSQVKPELERHGLEVCAAVQATKQRRAFVHLDSRGERTITTTGERLTPGAGDDLPWARLAGFDAVYVTAADAEGFRLSRAARKLVATIRAARGLLESGVTVDVVVASRNDPGEDFDLAQFTNPPGCVVRTDGAKGGTIAHSDGTVEIWEARPLESPWVDSYGAGDSFAAGITYGLGLGLPVLEAARIGALCGAANLQGRGPYAGQATAEDLARSIWLRTRRAESPEGRSPARAPVRSSRPGTRAGAPRPSSMPAGPGR